MDPTLLVVGAVILLVLVFFLRGSGNSAKPAPTKKDDGKSQSWRDGSSAQSMDPQLRNRHGIQNGEIKYWSLAEVAKHNKPDDLLIVVRNKVYDVTDFVEDHPGGAESIARNPGGDNTEKFSGMQHPAKVWDLIQDYYVGDVRKEEHVVYTFKVQSKM